VQKGKYPKKYPNKEMMAWDKMLHCGQSTRNQLQAIDLLDIARILRRI